MVNVPNFNKCNKYIYLNDQYETVNILQNPDIHSTN